MPDSPHVPPWVRDTLRAGTVIPAHPLALTADGAYDERRQRALTRYYAAAGAGGVAVGVHTTQFAIRDPAHGLLEPVLRTAGDALDEIERNGGPRLVRVAGVCGPTAQAVREAELAASLGYHAGLLSLSALPEADDDALLAHCRAVAGAIPLFGFYLQTAICGRPLGESFWRRFAEIDNAVAIKIAPFDRYRTLDVVHGVAQSGRAGEIALYTGNDDHIVADLLTPFRTRAGGVTVTQRIVGGLLGHWAVWTRRAVELFDRVRAVRDGTEPLTPELLTLDARVTDCNAALFDAAHGFAGCVAGINHVLHGQGLLASGRCLDPRERLSPGQAERIARVRRDHPDLTDDDFVAEHLDEWLS
ncbi:dihydrodipicolinate synthase family protein [Alienimonas sp. DA493]|uniref:dihydrodipicolinate synthase family protein n=1 Tax=Alienimonas sp. DA493 TaxID=3373605 RepID=UPI003753F6BE